VRKVTAREPAVLVELLKSSIFKNEATVPNAATFLVHPSRFDVTRPLTSAMIVFCKEFGANSDKEVIIDPARERTNAERAHDIRTGLANFPVSARGRGYTKTD